MYLSKEYVSRSCLVCVLFGQVNAACLACLSEPDRTSELFNSLSKRGTASNGSHDREQTDQREVTRPHGVAEVDVKELLARDDYKMTAPTRGARCEPLLCQQFHDKLYVYIATSCLPRRFWPSRGAAIAKMSLSKSRSSASHAPRKKGRRLPTCRGECSCGEAARIRSGGC